MSRPRARATAARKVTSAVLLRRVAIGDADWMLTFLTEDLGVMSAVARSARRSSKRFSSLEPMHTLRVGFDVRAGTDLATVAETAIARPRLELTKHLSRLEAAGRALRWVRRAVSPGTHEPEVWRLTERLLDGLDEADAVDPTAWLAVTGLCLVAVVGWSIELEACVHCGRPCPEGAPACVDVVRGGLVCRACGGAPRVLEPGPRRRLRAALAGAPPTLLEPGDAALCLDLVESTFAAHAGIERS